MNTKPILTETEITILAILVYSKINEDLIRQNAELTMSQLKAENSKLLLRNAELNLRKLKTENEKLTQEIQLLKENLT